MIRKMHEKGIGNIIFVLILLLFTTSVRLYYDFDVLKLFYLGVVSYCLYSYLKLKLN